MVVSTVNVRIPELFVSEEVGVMVAVPVPEIWLSLTVRFGIITLLRFFNVTVIVLFATPSATTEPPGAVTVEFALWVTSGINVIDG